MSKTSKISPQLIEKYKFLKKRQKGELDFVVNSGSESEGVVGKKKEEKVSTKERLIPQIRPSLLSSDAPPNKYDGFFNLAILILVISHLRLILGNIKKYGFLLDLKANIKIMMNQRTYPALLTFLSLNIWIIVIFLIEKWVGNLVKSNKHKKLPPLVENLIFGFQIFNLITFILFPIVAIFQSEIPPIFGLIIMQFAVMLWLKLVSYVLVNRQLRFEYYEKEGKSGKGDTQYPYNLSLFNIYYFIGIPVLVYEESFIQKKSINWSKLIRTFISFIFFCFLILFMVEQYMVPLVMDSTYALKTGNLFDLIEGLLRLTVPNIVVWLLFFYTFFHLYLNLWGELLRYGDRLFYLDWWNCTTMDYFWRTWNLPTHKWLVFHIYKPFVSNGYSSAFSSFMVFFVSALFHEVIVSIPFRTWKFWAFTGMMAQMPMCFLTKKYTKGKLYGNILFWFSFMFGQANCILLYYKDFAMNQ